MYVLLSARDVNKYFYEPTKFHVLKDINFDIERGKFVSVIGKSGCGKSTLLYLLSTMDTEYDGKITVNGEVLTGQEPEKLARFRNENIGFVFSVPLPLTRVHRAGKRDAPSSEVSQVYC